MRALLVSILTLFMCQSAFAITVKVKFDYLQGEKNKYTIEKEVNITEDNHNWVVIPASSKNAGNVMLLGKVENSDSDQVTMNFLVLTAGKKPEVLFGPQLVMSYAQEAKISVQKDKNSMELMAIASK